MQHTSFDYLAVITATLMLVSGCSLSPDLQTHSPRLGKLDLYLARASLAKAEFEQYRLSGPRLYVECGEFRNGRNVADQQSFVSLDQKTLDAVSRQAATVFNKMKDSSRALPLPGKAHGFADPGQALVAIEADGGKVDIKTSVDELSSPLTSDAESIYSLVVLIRNAALSANQEKPLCGNSSFYGIPGRL